MNINKFTQKSVEAVNGCQSVCLEYGNQQIEAMHLLYSLINIDDSLIAKLLQKMGVDFATFWAGRVQDEGGSLLVARVVPEDDLAKVARLDVTGTSDAGSVPVLVRRVYVTMAVCKQLPHELEQHQHRLLRDTTVLPAELCGAFPLVRRSDALTVVEWGGTEVS